MPPEALSIKIHGMAGPIERRAATLLESLVQKEILPGERGTVSIHTDVFLAGQRREQIDILLHAFFPEGLKRKIRQPSSPESLEVSFQDLLVVIEVKGHRRENVRFSGVKAEVRYEEGWKSASTQSHDQVHSVKPFLANQLGWEPWVCNLIFFSNLLEADLPTSPHNYLAADSSLQNLLERLQSPKKNSFRNRKRSMFFSCVFARDGIQREERNKQLEDLLQVKQIAAPPPTPRPLPPPPSLPQALPPLPPAPLSAPPQPHTLPQRQHTSRGSLALRAAFVLLVIAGLARVSIGRRAAAPGNAASPTLPDLPQPMLRTCAAITSRCGCNPSTRFHRGKTIFIQFISKEQKPSEESVHDPQGNILPLSFLHSNPNARHTDSGCFIAKYAPSHDAVPGSYFVQTTSETAEGHQSIVLSRGFQITP